MAIASKPSLDEFSALASSCPELCEEAFLLQFYSCDCLSSGREQFVVPDLQPLPSVVSVPRQSWSEDIEDKDFLDHTCTCKAEQVGWPSLTRCAYLLLQEQGRSAALKHLLGLVAKARDKQTLGGLGNETLTYLALHMVHFYASLGSWSFNDSFASFIASCGQKLLDPKLPYEFYSGSLLYSEEAKSSLVLPDLRPLPSIVSETAVVTKR
eukprot:TRINITY_DN8433_c2_g1_i1.p1 TRINITY_DN8433_c2_g1~~TRINITY_DN8433_c2_g1_i1.p1  ORF type:complete len:210 (+),score=29.87 TRINITY_DN8433_c2_g1_i1:2-631(+)